MSVFTKDPSLVQALVDAPDIGSGSLGTVSMEQGVYALWHGGPPEVCLKVGIAGPRSGKGLRDRLAFHYSSHVASSVLARHLAADETSAWVAGRNFRDRSIRQAFLATECFFRFLDLPGISRAELLAVEREVVAALRPIYVGRVRHWRAG